MGVWVTNTASGEVVDYSQDGSIVYDARIYTNRVDVDLPIGDAPRQYRWNGTQIVKLAPPPTSALAQALDAALTSPIPSTAQLKSIFQALRQTVT